jgi:protein-disulfide isomerase
MKAVQFLACAAALIAVGGCNNKQSENASNVPLKLEPVKPPAGGDWTEIATATPAGGFLMGNPQAKVQLIEYGSMTCPHCREFDESGVSPLINTYVKSGQVSYEFRNYVRDAFDLAASLIARCNGAKGFFPLERALYKDQINWVSKIQTIPQAQLDPLKDLPPNRQFLEIGKLAGFQDWAAMRGVPQAKSAQCLTNTSEVDQLVKMTADATDQFPDFPGTPTFIINGKMVELGPVRAEQVWPTLEGKIREALR